MRVCRGLGVWLALVGKNGWETCKSRGATRPWRMAIKGSLAGGGNEEETVPMHQQPTPPPPPPTIPDPVISTYPLERIYDPATMDPPYETRERGTGWRSIPFISHRASSSSSPAPQDPKMTNNPTHTPAPAPAPAPPPPSFRIPSHSFSHLPSPVPASPQQHPPVPHAASSSGPVPVYTRGQPGISRTMLLATTNAP